eukprot:12008060-Prorocentrum_lima.AAC.2
MGGGAWPFLVRELTCQVNSDLGTTKIHEGSSLVKAIRVWARTEHYEMSILGGRLVGNQGRHEAIAGL